MGLIYSLSRSAVTLGLELIQKRMERNQRVDSGGGRRPQEHRSIGRTRTSVSRAQVGKGKRASTWGGAGSKRQVLQLCSICNSALAQHVLCPVVLGQAGSKHAMEKAERGG